MSFPAARIEDYLLSRTSKDRPLTEVPFADTKIGDLEIVIVFKNRPLVENGDLLEEEIERQLAQEGLIRLPRTARQASREFEPIDVAGKPISEMIVEERR